MQADQTVLSLRPGGGTRGGSRVFGPRFDSSAAAGSPDLPLLRPHGGISASSLTSLKVGFLTILIRSRVCLFSMYFSNDFVFICYASSDLVNFIHADASDYLRIGINVV